MTQEQPDLCLQLAPTVLKVTQISHGYLGRIHALTNVGDWFCLIANLATEKIDLSHDKNRKRGRSEYEYWCTLPKILDEAIVLYLP